jgi:hypothetical protein
VSVTNSLGAQRMDIFSLGLVCLWLLFYNNDKLSTADMVALRIADIDLTETAAGFVKSCDALDEQERQRLRNFFRYSLQFEPSLRIPDDGNIFEWIVPERYGLHLYHRPNYAN